MELSEERLRNEYQQIKKYGHSALTIYMDYRNIINHKIKWLMIEISNAYKDKGLGDKKMEEVNHELLDKYNQFWSSVDPHIKAFYEGLSRVLEVKDSFEEEVCSEEQVEELVHSEKQIEDLKKDIKEMEIQILNEQYFLDSLKQIQESLDQQLNLKDQLSKELKVIERHSSQFKKKEKINQKIKEFVKNSDVCNGSLLRKPLTAVQFNEENPRKMELIKWLEKGDPNEPMPYEIKMEEFNEPAVLVRRTMNEDGHNMETS